MALPPFADHNVPAVPDTMDPGRSGVGRIKIFLLACDQYDTFRRKNRHESMFQGRRGVHFLHLSILVDRNPYQIGGLVRTVLLTPSRLDPDPLSPTDSRTPRRTVMEKTGSHRLERHQCNDKPKLQRQQVQGHHL